MGTRSNSFLPFHMPLIEEDDIQAVCNVLRSGWITTGAKSVQFEKEFARFVGSRSGVAVNSCTAALHLALEAIGLKEGDEVIVPTLTFAATAEVVVYFKALPILVDCEADTFNLNPVQVERAITSRTRAIIPVHFAGHPCDMTRITELARKYGIKVIEDAAHALPARYKGKMVGTIGDMTCFSFYATKNITTGEGGMVTTDCDTWADRMRVMRLHGISKDAWKRYTAEGSWKYDIIAPGFKYNLTDIQAAMGLTQLAKCHTMWGRRSQLAQAYTSALGPLDAFEVPTVRPDVQHAWHLYVLRICSGVLSIDRNALIEELRARGIGSSVHFIPLHEHQYYREVLGYRRHSFPIAEDFFDRCVSLPLYPSMTDEDQARVIDALVDLATNRRRFSSVTVIQRNQGPGTHQDNGFVDPAHNSTNLHSDIYKANSSTRLSGVPNWYLTKGKRATDVVMAFLGFTAMFPVIALCALAVWLDSRGPILFLQRRIGLGGRPFQLIKLRTMIANRETGPCVTVSGDPRITPVGKWLRRLKLDELPQLINVVKGDMSLVGPRPEVPKYVELYTGRQQEVLAIRPGMTGAASLVFINEQELLAGKPNREDYYTKTLLPAKLELELAYCARASMKVDLRILVSTLFTLVGLRWLFRGRGGEPFKDPPDMCSVHTTSIRHC